MNLASRLQKYVEIGRLVSAVIAFAWSNGSFVPFTQMLRVPLNGLRNAMYWPSGEICAPAISGSPKKRSRSMIGGKPAVDVAAARAACAHTGTDASGSVTAAVVMTKPRPARKRIKG